MTKGKTKAQSDAITCGVIPAHLMPDEREQFLQWDTIADAEWAIYDSWGIEFACKLITLGYPVDLKRMAEEVKGWPADAWGRDNFYSMVSVYSRALNIANSSVKAGTIKDPDTPAKWIEWAKGKGYSVAHLTHAAKETNEGEPRKLEPQGDEPLIMKKAALVAMLENEGFKDVKNVFRHAAENGLSKAAKHENHGYWCVAKARAWFTQNRPKQVSAATPDTSSATAKTNPWEDTGRITTHRCKG